MKYYLTLVTGGTYFLTPCVIIMAKDEDDAIAQLRENNPSAFRMYRIALDRIALDEVAAYADEGAHLAETGADIAQAF